MFFVLSLWNPVYISHLKHNLIRTSHILSDQYHKWLVATILDRVVPYHDCGGGYTTVYFCQNSLNHTLKVALVYCM